MLYLAIVVIGSLALFATVLAWTPIELGQTLSQHIQRNRHSIVLGAAMLSVIGAAMLLWAATSQLAWYMATMPAAIGICLAATGWIPLGRSWRCDLWHNCIAWGSALLAFLFDGLVAAQYGGAVRWLASLVVVGQFVLAALFYFRWSRRWSLLIGQASYFVMYVIVLWSIELQHSGVL